MYCHRKFGPLSKPRLWCLWEDGYSERLIRTLKLETPSLRVRGFDTCGFSTKNLVLTLRNCGLNKRMHFSVFQATEENQLVIAAEIQRKIGLGEIDESAWVIRGILQKLKNEERVEQREERGPWKLTEVEYQKRR